jgi:probable rRNA maturation factor
MDVFISDLQDKHDIDTRQLQERALEILTALNCDKFCQLSIALVDDRQMHRLNLEYRGIDRSTVVLSFALQDAKDPKLNHHDSEQRDHPIVLGDVILSTETAQRQACEHHNSFDREFYFLLIHGILHLLGHNHDSGKETRVMQTLEQTLLKKLGQ